MYCGKYKLSKDVKDRKKSMLSVTIPKSHIGTQSLELKKYFMDSYSFDKYDIIKFEDAVIVSDRVEFCEQLITQSPMNLNTLSIDAPKVDEISLTNNLLAKNFFNIGSYRLALVYINCAVSYAYTNDYRALCYSGRAEVFFKAKMWEPCLASINLINYEGIIISTDTKNRIQKMLDTISAEMGNLSTKLPKPLHPSSYVDVPKLHCKPQTGVPFADECISAKYDKNGTVYEIIAKSYLPVGEAIIIEDNMCQTLVRDVQYSRCDFCFEECDYNLIPCGYCVSSMYCDNLNTKRTCATNAWEAYHRYECPINEILYAIHPYKTIVRLLITSFVTEKDIDEFIEFTNSPDYKIFNAFTMDWSNRPHNYTVKLFYAQKSGESVRTNGDRFVFSRMAAYLVLLLTHKTSLVRERFNTPKRLKFLREFIYRSILISSMNSTFVGANSTIRFSYDNQSFNIIGCNIRAFQPMFQHNCKANLAILNVGLNKSVIYTQRPVNRGETLTIDYVRNHHVAQRPEVLKLQLNYACECIVDNENTKFISYALRRDHHVDIDKIDACLKLFLANKETVVKLKELCCKYLEEHDYEYPTFELYRHCFVLERCLQRLYGIPILFDVGHEQYFNYFDSIWTYGNKQLDAVYQQYQKKYKNGEQIYSHLVEFLHQCIPYKKDAYYPRRLKKMPAMHAEIKGINVSKELKYFQQFAELPNDYHLQQNTDLVYALIMLNDVFPKANNFNRIRQFKVEQDEIDELLNNFREYLECQHLINDDDYQDDKDQDNKDHNKDDDKRQKK